MIPLLGGNHLSVYYATVDKFWIETVFLLLLTASICVSFFMNRKTQTSFLKFCLFFLPYLLMNAVSLFYTWNRFNTLKELNMAVWTLGCVYIFSQSEKRDSLLKALVLGASLVAIFMIIQYKILLPNLANVFKDGRYASIVHEKVVPFASYLNEATLGGYFLFVIPLSIYLAVFEKKIVYAFLSSIVIFGLLLSLSRMGILLLAFSMMAMVVFVFVKKGLKGLLIVGLIVVMASSMLVALVYVGNQRDNTVLRETAFYKAKKIPEHITSLTYRTVTWKHSLAALRDKPLLGYGAGAFEYAYRKYYEASLYTRYAHNTLIKIAVELGLLGIVCFFFYLSGLGVGVKKRITETRYFFVFLSVSAGFLFSLFNVTFEIPAYASTFFILSSMFFVEGQKVKKGARLVFLPLIAVLLGSFFFTAKADISQKLYEDGVLFDENGLSVHALTCYKEAIKNMPLNNNGYIGVTSILTKSYFAARNVQQKDATKTMIAEYLPRMERNPDKDTELFLLLGIAYSIMSEGEKAEKYFSEATSYYPSSGYYLYERANFYFQHGQAKKAILLVKRMEEYEDRHAGSDMHGLYVYKMRDLQSDIEYMNGRPGNALSVARKNLRNAENEKGVVENVRSREYVMKDSFIKYFKGKVDFYESKSRETR
jgi:O-antigen ligase